MQYDMHGMHGKHGICSSVVLTFTHNPQSHLNLLVGLRRKLDVSNDMIWLMHQFRVLRLQVHV